MKYIMSFSLKDLLSALFSSLVISALFSFFLLFELFDDYYIVMTLTFLIPFALSHRFYFIEHKRSNNFIGRILHDILISFFLFLFLILLFHITDTFYKIGFYSNAIMVVAFATILCETALSIIKLGLRIFKIKLW